MLLIFRGFQLNEMIIQLVEILFARGLVKILFATETFAMVRTNYIFPAAVS